VFNEGRTQVTLTSNKSSRSLKFFYRSAQMMRPQLLFEESSQFPDEVAVMASFVPTLEQPQPQEEFEVLQDEEPESASLSKGDEFFYVFIVDRSGSMSGRKIEVTKYAMKLFIQSLPPNCKFQIISFGTTYETMTIHV
jgi:Mg-chelatase subunit ChlD